MVLCYLVASDILNKENQVGEKDDKLEQKLSLLQQALLAATCRINEQTALKAHIGRCAACNNLNPKP